MSIGRGRHLHRSRGRNTVMMRITVLAIYRGEARCGRLSVDRSKTTCRVDRCESTSPCRPRGILWKCRHGWAATVDRSIQGVRCLDGRVLLLDLERSAWREFLDGRRGWRRSKGTTIHHFQMMLNSWFCHPQIFLIWKQPLLI